MSKANWWNIKAMVYGLRNRLFFGKILERENQAASELLKSVPAGAAMLDIGTGLGNGFNLVKAAYSVKAGLDFSVKMLCKNRKLTGNKNLAAGRAEAAPFPDNCFNLVLCIGLAEYYSDVKTLLNEIVRMLKPGGYLLITASPDNAFTTFRKIWGSRIYPMEKSKMTDILEYMGLSVVGTGKTLMQQQFLAQKESL